MLEVGCESITDVLEKLGLGMEEPVALRPIGLIVRLIVFLRRKTDLTPFSLQVLHLLGSSLPLFGAQRLTVYDGFVNRLELVDDGLLGLEVCLLFGMQVVEIGLMFLIDNSRSGFETVP